LIHSSDSVVKRVGLFGGAFDPPHTAHVALVQAALQQLQLHEVRVLPTGQAWHKPRTLTDRAHRLTMARLAFEGMPEVVLDPRELNREGPSFTIDTVLELQAEQPHAKWWLLLGQDQWQAFNTWHEWQALAGLVQVAVAVRNADRLLPTEHPMPDGKPPLRAQRLMLPAMAVSATHIRHLASQGGDLTSGLAGLVSPAVARYIDQHHLYR
jgi:nicotinate-nucleotide adenylyltransferase